MEQAYYVGVVGSGTGSEDLYELARKIGYETWS